MIIWANFVLQRSHFTNDWLIDYCWTSSEYFSYIQDENKFNNRWQWYRYEGRIRPTVAMTFDCQGTKSEVFCSGYSFVISTKEFINVQLHTHCPQRSRFPYRNDVRFVFTSSCLWDRSCFMYVICVCLHIVVSNTYLVVLLFCISSSCVSYVASFSGLSMFDCPFGIL